MSDLPREQQRSTPDKPDSIVAWPQLDLKKHKHFRRFTRDHTEAAVESILDAVIPDVHAHLSESDRDPLPVAQLAASRQDGSLHYGMNRIDNSGRISDQALLRSVSWKPGDRLDAHVVPGTIVFQPRATGLLTVGKPWRLPIPAAARQYLGITCGSKVLVAAIPKHRLIVVYPLATLDLLISQHHASIET
jgi:hypothetical protein